MNTPYDWLAHDGELSAAEWEAAFADWACLVFFRRGQPRAAVFQKGAEVHLVVAPAARGAALFRHDVRECLSRLRDSADGFLTTRLLHGSGNRRFVERLGFERTWSDERFDYFALRALPFSKDALK